MYTPFVCCRFCLWRRFVLWIFVVVGSYCCRGLYHAPLNGVGDTRALEIVERGAQGGRRPYASRMGGVVISGRVGQGPLSRKLRWRRALRVVAGPRVTSGWHLPFSQLMPTSWHSIRQSQLVGDISCSAFPRFVCAGTPRTHRSAKVIGMQF